MNAKKVQQLLSVMKNFSDTLPSIIPWHSWSCKRWTRFHLSIGLSYLKFYRLSMLKDATGHRNKTIPANCKTEIFWLLIQFLSFSTFQHCGSHWWIINLHFAQSPNGPFSSHNLISSKAWPVLRPGDQINISFFCPSLPLENQRWLFVQISYLLQMLYICWI